MRRTAIRRDTPKSRAFAAKRSEIKRKKPIPKVNPGKKARTDAAAWGDGSYARWLRSQGCLICGRGPADCHHVRSRAAGGRESDLLPLCRACHDLAHLVGPETFGRRYGVNLRLEADRLWLAWSAFRRDWKHAGAPI